MSRSSNQGSNDMLLNAIKTKFSSNIGTDDNNFNMQTCMIPPSQLPTTTGVHKSEPHFNHQSCKESSAPVSKLNQFLLDQLKNRSIENTKTFTIPKLNFGPSLVNNLQESKLIANNNLEKDTFLKSLNTEMKDLQINESKSDTPHLQQEISKPIDLTIALNDTTGISSTEASTEVKPKSSQESRNFEIPFIACDLKDNVDTNVPTDIYCELNASLPDHKGYLVRPSMFGKIVCLKYRNRTKYPPIDHSFKAKHKIVCFHFNTKSPDEMYLEKLKKFKSS